jgi:hypothetical protein
MPTIKMIARKVVQLNKQLGRPALPFTETLGKPTRAEIGHIGFEYNPAKGGYRLLEITSECGDTDTGIFGLVGQYHSAECFYTILNVILSCTRR